MKHKPKKDSESTAPRKVFDVMRPGKTVAEPTARSVIVGHKPQVKDPMMSDRNEERSLMDSNKKVTLQPTNDESKPAPVADALVADQPSDQQPDASTAPTPTEQDQSDTQTKPYDGPYVADELATLATSTTVDTNSSDSGNPGVAEAQSEQEPPVPAAAEPTVPEVSKPESQNPGTTGIVFEDASDFQASVQQAQPSKPDDTAEPLPTMPDEQPVSAQPQIVVSHHNYSNGWLKFFVTFAILAVVAVIVVDILLDSGILVKDGIPHTHFF